MATQTTTPRFVTRQDEVAYPVRIEGIGRPYHLGERIPWETATTLATCKTLTGVLRRYRQERAGVRHNHGSAWSGHVRAVDARGRVLDIRAIEVDPTVGMTPEEARRFLVNLEREAAERWA